MKHNHLSLSALGLAMALAYQPVHATNGFFLPGSGVRSSGMGGVGIAYGADSLSANANPANIVKTGMRGDMGFSVFNPERYAKVGAPAGQRSGFNGTFNGDVESEARYFVMPEMGFTMPLTEQLSVGVAVLGSGGMNTTYPANFFSYMPGVAGVPPGTPSPAETIGVDMMQVLVPVSVGYKVNDDHAVGASLVMATTRFRAYGLQAFPAFDDQYAITADQSAMTNVGFDYSYGAGLKLGWQGDFLEDKLTVGLVYTSRTYMTKFDKYKGLFAEQGGFDIPESYGIGFAIKPVKNLVIAADVSRINFSKVKSFGNLGPGTASLPYNGGNQLDALPSIADDLDNDGVSSKELGNDAGMGFGWKDQTVYKLGIQYGVNSKLQVRAGYNYGKSPVPNNQLTFNTLAPGVVEKHYTAGFTYKPTDELEITGSYMHVPEKSQVSPPNQNIVGMAAVGMSQRVYGLSLGWVLDPGQSGDQYGEGSVDSEPWGFYAGMSLAGTDNKDWNSSSINSDLAASGITATSEIDNTDANGNIAWKLFGGYEINRFFAVETGYMAFQDVYANVSATAPTVGTARLGLQTEAWMLAAKGTYPVSENFSLFAKLGANFWDQTLLTTNTTVYPNNSPSKPLQGTQVSESDSGSGLYYGVGASYDLGKYLTLRAEWERFDVNGADIDAFSGGVLFKF